jgi:hypothetical protein
MIQKILEYITPKVYAGTVDLGTIKGVGEFQDPANASGAGLESLISAVLGTLTAVSALAFLTYFVLGGIQWITAGGKQESVQKAQKQMTDAAVGLLVVIVAYFIAGIIGFILGIDILNPATIINSLT